MENIKVNCRGQCLRQSYRYDNVCVRYIICDQNCEPIKCTNFEICKRAAPEWVLDCHKGRCMFCDPTFYQNLKIESINDICPICLEDYERMVTMPGCTHKFCILCFRKIYHVNIPNIDSEVLINETEDTPYDEDNEIDNGGENEDNVDEIDNEEGNSRYPKCLMCRHHFFPSYFPKDYVQK